MARLFDPTTPIELPLVKGKDVDIEVIYKPLLVDGNGDPILDGEGKEQYVEDDIPAGAVVWLIVDPSATGDATIDGSKATMRIDHTLVDKTRNGTLWRVKIRYSDGLDDVLVNGWTHRYDGDRR